MQIKNCFENSNTQGKELEQIPSKNIHAIKSTLIIARNFNDIYYRETKSPKNPKERRSLQKFFQKDLRVHFDNWADFETNFDL